MSSSTWYRIVLYLTACIAWSSFALPTAASAEPPHLYHQPAYESPVSGEPGDLLLIAGYGFAAGDEVIYQAIDAVGKLAHPETVPVQHTAALGIAHVVSVADAPYSITVRLPEIMRSGQPYALWVRTAAHEWSQPVFINDPRPLWLSPAFVFARAELASLPRELKIVGRNLQPADRSGTEVRLTGPVDMVLKASPAAADALDHYTVSVKLPERMTPGRYRVRLTRDGIHWVELTGQTLEVRPDPPRSAEFPVGALAYGGCKADDSADAAPCIIRAISAAAAAGGGTVVFGPGTWHLSELSISEPDGIVVPLGVNLRGAGSRNTTVVQDADGRSMQMTTTFTLLGNNIVRDLTFRDAHVYAPRKWLGGAFFQLGLPRHEGAASLTDPAASVEDVVFTQNVFAGPNVAIGGASPIKRLVVTYNEFRAFRAAIDLSADRFLVNERFGVQDSIFSHNTFKPGSYLDTAIRQGTMASELGASSRVDFSYNTADGAAVDALNSPTDPRGWRAGFFWHLNNDSEMLLVSENHATCTGDKDGDGEAISFDNNANTFALPRAGKVLRAGAASVTVAGPLIKQQFGSKILIDDYYVGHWIQVGEGPGLGQVRKVVSYHVDAADGSVTFRVRPDWDVVPAAAQSRISIGREYWQVYTVANVIDQRRPLCQKSNRTDPKGGGISIWGQMADSVVDGNRQYDTDGVIFQQFYRAAGDACPNCSMESDYLDFFEIRGNVIDGEYGWDNDCSSSGIFGSLAASPGSPPPTVSYGLTIAHNIIDRADGRGGGAISMLTTWFEGPAPHRWPLADNALIYRNTLTGLDAPPAKPCKRDPSHARTGISLGGSHLNRHAVLFANACPNARRRHDSLPADAIEVCPRDAALSCECPAPMTK